MEAWLTGRLPEYEYGMIFLLGDGNDVLEVQLSVRWLRTHVGIHLNDREISRP